MVYICYIATRSTYRPGKALPMFRTPISAISNPLYRYVGMFSDSSYGPDFEGQLFESIEDAKLWLSDAHNVGHRFQVATVHINGEKTRDFMPCVSTEAEVLLYRIDDVEQRHLDRQRELEALFEEGQLSEPVHPRPLVASAERPAYEASELDYPDYRVFIGPRGGMRSERA